VLENRARCPDNRSQFLSRNARPRDLSPAGFLLAVAAAAVTFHGLTERGRGSFGFSDRPWSFGLATLDPAMMGSLAAMGSERSCSFCRDLREFSFRFTSVDGLISAQKPGIITV